MITMCPFIVSIIFSLFKTAVFSYFDSSFSSLQNISLFLWASWQHSNIVRWLREINLLQIEKNACKLRKYFINLTTHVRCKCSQHNQIKKCTTNKNLYLFALWAFAVRLLPNWWKCFLDLLVLFLFACVFWSCSALSSLGHRNIDSPSMYFISIEISAICEKVIF